MPEYVHSIQGIKLLLVKSVIEEKCKDCGEVTYTIPNPKGLVAAVAIHRATMDIKLNGAEISWMRKALDMSSKKLAQVLEVTQETMSRWENDKQPMGPAPEKVLRTLVALMLQDRAPLIEFDVKEIMKMRIRGIREPQPLELCLELVRTKTPDKKTEETYSELKEVA